MIIKTIEPQIPKFKNISKEIKIVLIKISYQ